MTNDSSNWIDAEISFSTVIQGRNVTVCLPSRIAPALSGLPSVSPAFVGRADDLRALLDCVKSVAPEHRPPTADQSAASVLPAVMVASVDGMGGIGKTELALQAARTALQRGWFPGGVLFVNLFGYDTIRRLDPGGALNGWLRALGIPSEHIPLDTQDRARLFASVLTAYAEKGRRILLVIDNASTHEQVKPLLPTDGTNAAIITSRHKLSMLDARRLELKSLTLQDGITLIQRSVEMICPGDTRIGDHPDYAKKIVELCGRLPLALRIIAALLADTPTRSPAEMVADLIRTDSRLEEMCYFDAENEIAVRATFNLSYQHLPSDQARLFRFLALVPGNEFGIESAAVLTRFELPHARRGLARLRSAHLIEDSSTTGRYRFHDLMRDYARERLAAEDGESERDVSTERLLQHYQQVTASAAQWLNEIQGERFSSLEQALSWLDTEYPNLFAAVVAAHDSGRWLEAYSLATGLAGYIEFRYLVKDGIAAQTRALDAATRLGPLQQATAAANLGNAHRVARDYVASIKYLEQALAITKADSNLAMKGKIKHNLGLTYFRMGRYASAESCHRIDLSICEVTHDLRGRAQALTALGNAQRMQKHYSEAAGNLKEAISLFERLKEPTEIISVRIIFALTLLDWRPMSDNSYIIWQLCSALKAAEEIEARIYRAMIFLNLGVAYMKRCRICHHDAAIHWSKEAAALFAALRDPYQEAIALRNIGIVYREAGETSEAHRHLQKALTLFQELGLVEEIRTTRVLLSKDIPPVIPYCGHSQEDPGRFLTSWCDDLPHAVLRGENAKLEEIAFLFR
ncbi:ATP-binding protein [Streptosporangium longisporum]|uniref:NB-ARC domain-containing protein n=1 Tax=Streptosporangium longisporum TaxID=46187 RepID=A0ABP6KRA2_9ACTN